MKLKSTRKQYYRTRALRAGEEFEEPSSRYARILKALGRAEDAEVEAKRESEPEPESEFESEAEPGVALDEPDPDPEAEQKPLTRTDLRRMNKRELVEYLETVDFAADPDATRDELLEFALVAHESGEGGR